MKQELVLIRANNDANTVVYTEANHETEISITRVSWIIPYVMLGLRVAIILNTLLESNEKLMIGFHTWDTHEWSGATQSDTNTRTVQTTSQEKKLRYVIRDFQTGRKNQVTKEKSKFDSCNLKNLKVTQFS